MNDNFEERNNIFGRARLNVHEEEIKIDLVEDSNSESQGSRNSSEERARNYIRTKALRI